jgi:2,4-dienoyl-CoA reductase-like NADH-dependent reductase (Old Yellow Enzyme family)
MPTPFPHLFSPIQLGPLRAKNRVMRLATTSNLADGNHVGPRQLAFYETVAKGGAGTIVTESLRMFPQDTFPAGAIAIHDRAALPGLRKLSAACHASGALLLGQLNSGGRQHTASRIPGWMIAPSAIACPRSGGVPHELTLPEIKDVIDTYAQCAANCIEAGMDGVEVHGAQGHLIGQFLSPFTNHRTDAYGGSPEKRLRFAIEILEKVRTRVGPEAIVGYRMGVEEFTEGGLGIEDTLAIAQTLTKAGLADYLSLAQGNFNSIDAHLPDRHWPPLAYRALQARFKAACPDTPTIMSARIQTPEQAEDVVASGDADMIGLCRALIVDPEWPAKASAGESHRIRGCIACNQCWGWISEGGPIACATNPVAGHEWRMKPLAKASVKARKAILVIGAGPAGLEAARVAALRGHDVTLLEASDRPGGRMKDAHLLPHQADLANLLGFLIPEAERAGVQIVTGHTATTADILARKPDAVIIATGAEAVAPALPGDGSVPVLTGDGAIDLSGIRDGALLVMDEDGYFWSAAVTEGLLATGRPVTVVSRFFETWRELPMVSRIATLRAADQKGAVLKPNTEITSVSNSAVTLRHYTSGRTEVVPGIAAIVWIGAARPSGTLAQDLLAAGYDKSRLHVIGDAFSPRRLVHALGEAHAAGRAV